ncbi:MAG: hypothetical protein H6876_01020 [Hyphomicrobiaceae bacterium]|nr:hypothetical protein [Hyphomicrobiaceae bacterium]
MDDLALARALHVLAIVHWIGGVSLVTLVLLPGIRRNVRASERLELFEMIESRFAFQARISTVLAGASGFYMTHQIGGWERFASSDFWWMHAMFGVWLIFTIVLFVAEPLFLHRWFKDRAISDSEGTFRIVQRMHFILLGVSLVTVAGAMIGVHGGVG